jgi:hypothetical protein
VAVVLHWYRHNNKNNTKQNKYKTINVSTQTEYRKISRVHITKTYTPYYQIPEAKTTTVQDTHQIKKS